MVHKIATASFPPARRVHTAAEANVEGTLAAIINPMPRSARSNCDTGHATSGTAKTLSATARITAFGWRSAFHMLLASSGKAIKNSTTATINCRGICIVSGSSDAGNPKPMTSIKANEIKNQRLRKKCSIRVAEKG